MVSVEDLQTEEVQRINSGLERKIHSRSGNIPDPSVEAIDLVQIAWVKSFIAFSNNPNGVEISEGLLALASKHALFDLLRNSNHARNCALSINPTDDYPDGLIEFENHDIGPEDQVILNEEREIILAQIDELMSDYKQVLFLLYFMELNNEEISAVMNRSVNAVKILAFRARQSLKAKLTEVNLTDYDLG